MTAEAPLTDREERSRRWRLALGIDDASEAKALSPRDQCLSRALDALYGDGSKKGKGGLGKSAPNIAKWLGDIRTYFPASVVQVIQKDAFERKGLQQMLLEPEFLATVQADVHLVANLMALRGAIPDKTRETARAVIRTVVDALMERLAQRTADAIRGGVDRTRRTTRPRFANIDWPRTIVANLRHYQPEHQTIIPERLIGFMNRKKRKADLDEVILCVDQSGSMASSVVYVSIFAAVMASLPVITTRLICFDTAVIDLTEELADPVEVLFGVQLGGGTDINRAVTYCADQIARPTKAHLVLITDLYEGGNAEDLVTRLAWLHRQGTNVIVLLALTDTGRPAYNPLLAEQVAGLGIPVFSCTPDRFPDLMAVALRREDVAAWAAEHDIKTIVANQTSRELSS